MPTLLEFTRITKIRNVSYLHLFKFHNSPPHSRTLSTGIIPPHTPLVLKDNICVRQMDKKDLSLAIDWAIKEGWNPGKHEIGPLYAADPNGYYMMDVDGKPVASLAAVRHSKHFAFLGLFIVLPDFRNQGYGTLLWDTVFDKIRLSTSIGLNSVTEQIVRYEKSGFRASFLNTRWRGKLADVPSDKNLSNEMTLTNHLSEKTIENIIQYDGRIFSTPRAAFITQWIKMPESHALAALDKQGNLCGYGVISRTEEGYKIAPLFANNQSIATQLYSNLCHFVGKNETVHIDTCETNPFASTMILQF